MDVESLDNWEREPCAEIRKQLSAFRARSHVVNPTSTWEQNIQSLRKHLTEDCAELQHYRRNRWEPHVFNWPEKADQNKNQLDKISPEWMEILHRRGNYGPDGVRTYSFNGKKVQLDRVQQTWTLSQLSDKLGMPMQDEQTWTLS